MDKMMSLGQNQTSSTQKQLSAPKILSNLGFPNDFLIKFSTFFSLLLLVFMAGALAFPGKTYISTVGTQQTPEIFEETPGETFGCDSNVACCQDMTVQNTPPVCDYLKAKVFTDSVYSTGTLTISAFPVLVDFKINGVDADSFGGGQVSSFYQDLAELKIDYGDSSALKSVPLSNSVSAGDNGYSHEDSHTYSASNTYTAKAKFYDRDGAVSNECSIVIQPQEQAPTYSIGDFVWEDININGIQDADEPGIANFQISLTTDSSCNSNQVALAKTDANGRYSISELTPGTYYVQMVGYAGSTVWYSTEALQGGDSGKDSNSVNCSKIVITNDDMTIDYGYYKPGKITIKKTDTTGNNLAGAQILISSLKLPSSRTITTTSEPFILSDLKNGSYVITETVAPALYTKATPDVQTVALTESNESKTVTFVNTLTATPKHLVCENNLLCKEVTGTGENECAAAGEVCGKHLECDATAKQCKEVVNTTGDTENKGGCTVKDAECGTTPPTVKSCETVTVAFENNYTTHYIGDKVYITAKGTSTHANGVTSFKFRFGGVGATVVTCGKNASTSPLCTAITRNADNTYQTTLTYTLQTVGAFEVYGAACDDSGSCSAFSN